MGRRNTERKNSLVGEIKGGQLGRRVIRTENNERKDSWHGEITRGRIVGTEK